MRTPRGSCRARAGASSTCHQHAGGLVLHGGDRGRQPPQHRQDLGTLVVVRGHLGEHVGDRHRVPADGAPPELRRRAGLRVGPALGLALVPAVVEEAGLRRRAGADLGEQDLLGGVVQRRRLREHRRVLRQERRRHVHAVRPHLVRVDLLVPEAAVAGARLGVELRAQHVQHLAVAFLVGRVGGRGVQREQHLAHVDVVEREPLRARNP